MREKNIYFAPLLVFVRVLKIIKRLYDFNNASRGNKEEGKFLKKNKTKNKLVFEMGGWDDLQPKHNFFFLKKF